LPKKILTNGNNENKSKKGSGIFPLPFFSKCITESSLKIFIYKHIIRKNILKKRNFRTSCRINIYNYNQLDILTFQPGKFFGKHHPKYYLKLSALRAVNKIRD